MQGLQQSYILNTSLIVSYQEIQVCRRDRGSGGRGKPEFAVFFLFAGLVLS